MILIIIILGIFLDRSTKLWALETLRGNDGIVIIKNFFSFDYLENRGAAFGILQGRVSVLTIVTSCVVVALIIYLFKYSPKSKLMKYSLALIISGAIGNLYDRIVYQYVVDFILLHYKDVYYFPTFNIADMLVVFGTAIMAIFLLREDSNGKV